MELFELIRDDRLMKTFVTLNEFFSAEKFAARTQNAFSGTKIHSRVRHAASVFRVLESAPVGVLAHP
jgi:hypothetical protein